MSKTKTAKSDTLTSVSSTDIGRPAQYKQPSRKGKRSWRKNIDLSATEAALEDIREQERTVGAPAHKRKDAELFVEDRSGQETQLARQARGKRKLKSQEILAQRSAVPAIPHRQRSTFQLDTKTRGGKAAASGLSEKVKRRLRILASRPHEGEQGLSEMGSAGKIQSDAVLAEKHDLWGAEAPQPANDWVAPAMVTGIHKPRSMQHEPHAPAKVAPAVTKPHPGTSYNPDFDSHEALIQKAFDKAKTQEMTEEEVKRLTEKFKDVSRPKNMDSYMGMVIDQPDESAADAEDDENDDNDLPLAPKLPGRKTSAQRRREARAKEQQRQAMQRRKERQLRAMMSELPTHLKKMKKVQQTRAEMIQQRRERKRQRLEEEGIAGFKVGKHKVPEQRMDVQTGEELSESLRQLKPEGNLFWDRFQSLQARGLAEARKPVLPTRRRLKTKTYDRHSFKRD